MAWTQNDLDTIRKAIAGGIKAVTFADGRRQEFQNAGELLAIEKLIASQLQVQADTLVGKGRRRVPFYKPGL